MEATLSATAVRNFKRTLTCMSRFGDELHLKATQSGLQISTFNTSKTAFCMTSFKPRSFERYRFHGDNSASGDTEVMCRLQIKSILSVFGRGQLPQNLLKLHMQIKDPEARTKRTYQSRSHGSRRGHLRAEDDDELDDGVRTAALVLRLICKQGVIKTYSLNVGSSEYLVASIDPRTFTGNFVVPARTMKGWMEHFIVNGVTVARGANDSNGGVNRYETELGWYFAPDEVRVRTWEGGFNTKKIVSTEIQVSTDEFDDYYAAKVVRMTFPMKEFKAAITLADSFSIPLIANFSDSGQPISLKLEIEDVDIEMVIASKDNDAFSDLRDDPTSTNNKPDVKTESQRLAKAHAKSQASPWKGKSPAHRTYGLNVMKPPPNPVPQPRFSQNPPPGAKDKQPLFYPSGSQEEPRMSQAELTQRAADEQMQNMTQEDLDAFFRMSDDDDDEAEPVAPQPPSGRNQHTSTRTTTITNGERPLKIPRIEEENATNTETILGRSLFDDPPLQDGEEDDSDEELPATLYERKEGRGQYRALFDD